MMTGRSDWPRRLRGRRRETPRLAAVPHEGVSVSGPRSAEVTPGAQRSEGGDTFVGKQQQVGRRASLVGNEHDPERRVDPVRFHLVGESRGSSLENRSGDLDRQVQVRADSSSRAL